jgi:membrane-bound lytic murein transglycosylase B
MRRSTFFRQPTARAFAVAVAAGGALLPLVGAASAAPLVGTFQVASSTMATATSTTLTTSPASTVAQDAPVTLIAAVTPATATGTVQFRAGTTDIGTPGTVTDGTTSVTTSTSALAVGTHQLTAVFTPTNPAAYDPSASPAVSLAVTAPEGSGAPQTTIIQPQQSVQSLDEPVPADPAPSSTAPPRLADGPLGIPGVMLDAYQHAEQTMADTQPGCHLPYTLLAAIGKIESSHASDGRVDAAGNTLGPIRGQRLDGSPGIAAISDTDQGALDGDSGWDRAVGPMQFIPSSWRRYGVGDPDNIYDSTLAAGRYLCAGGTDLSDPAQQQAAVFRYNHSAPYVTSVLRWAVAYQTGVVPTPSAPGLVPPVRSGDGGLVFAAAPAPQAPVVAQLDAPAVADLDTPSVADLDTPLATSSATTPTPQSLD